MTVEKQPIKTSYLITKITVRFGEGESLPIF